MGGKNQPKTYLRVASLIIFGVAILLLIAGAALWMGSF